MNSRQFVMVGTPKSIDDHFEKLYLEGLKEDRSHVTYQMESWDMQVLYRDDKAIDELMTCVKEPEPEVVRPGIATEIQQLGAWR